MCGAISSRNRGASEGREEGAAVPAGPSRRAPLGAELKLLVPPTDARAGLLRKGRSRPLIRVTRGGRSRAERLLHHNLADHLRVQRAEVAVDARLGEREGVG